MSLCLCPGHAAAAASPKLVILGASADPTTGLLIIHGQGFGKANPIVALAGVQLPVGSATPGEIVANLPADLAPGTYLLSVARGPATTEVDTFNVTVGAVGPAGSPGAFTGHFESPSGAYSLEVTDAGIRLAGPSATIEIVGGTATIAADNIAVLTEHNIAIRSGTTTDLRSDGETRIRAGTRTNIDSGENTAITSGTGTLIRSGASTDIRGVTILLNGAGPAAARAGDTVTIDPVTGVGSIVPRPGSVLIGD